MEPNIVIYSDLHLGHHGNRVNDEGQNVKLMDVLEAQRQVFDYVLSNPKIEQLWFLGDLFDQRDKIPIPVLSLAGQQFEAFTKALEKAGRSRLRRRYLVGNHDLYVKSKRDTTTNIFLGKLEVVDKPEIVGYPGKPIYEIWIPYTLDMNMFNSVVIDQCSLIRQSDPNAKIILLMHQTITGALTGQSNFVLGDEGISLATVSIPDLTFSGHIHKPQSMSPTVHYIGSTLQLNFGEWTEDKGMVLLDINTFEWARYPVNTPRYTVIESNKQEEITNAVAACVQSGQRPWMIRVDTENTNVPQMLSEIPGLSENGVKVNLSSKQAITRVSEGNDAIEHNLASSDEELIGQYLTSRFGDLAKIGQKTGLNPNLLIDVGLSLLKGASDV